MDETRELLKQAKNQGITIKSLSKMTGISVNTLYRVSCGRNLSKEKKEIVYNTLAFILDNLRF